MTTTTRITITITTTITITIKQFTTCFKFKLLFETFVIFSCLSENRNFNSNLLREKPGKADTRDRHAILRALDLKRLVVLRLPVRVNLSIFSRLTPNLFSLRVKIN